MYIAGSYSIRLYIWEKGNVGMADLSNKLAACFKQAVCDYLLEISLLPRPIAQLGDTPDDFISPRSTGSPFIIIDTPTPSPWKSPGLHRSVSGDPSAVGRRSELSSKRRIFETAMDKAMLGDKHEGATSIERAPMGVSEAPVFKRRASIGIIEGVDKMLKSLSSSVPKQRSPEREEGGSSDSPEQLTWNQKEKIRREQEAREAAAHEAHCGRTGVLEPAYQLWIPRHLEFTHAIGSPSVTYHSFELVSSHSAYVFLSQAMADIRQTCPDISASAFKALQNGRLGGDGATSRYLYYLPEQDLTKTHRVEPEIMNMHYIVIGRNVHQWEESCNPNALDSRITQAWLDPSGQSMQLFHPLDSKKFTRQVEVPFQQMANGGKTSFIPRQRLVVLSITNDQVGTIAKVM